MIRERSQGHVVCIKVMHACGLHAHVLAVHGFTTISPNNIIYMYSDKKIKTPREHISFIHQRFLLKICKAKGSGFEGLKYCGGPELKCGTRKNTVIMESVCYENGEGSEEAKITVQCSAGHIHDINEEVLFINYSEH